MAIVMAQQWRYRGSSTAISTSPNRSRACRAVRRFESGMVVNPITITPEAALAEAQALMTRHKISGIPVVEASGKLVGILTNRDVRFAGNPRQPGRRADDSRRISRPSRQASARRKRGACCTSAGSRSCSWWTMPIAASA